MRQLRFRYPLRMENPCFTDQLIRMRAKIIPLCLHQVRRHRLIPQVVKITQGRSISRQGNTRGNRFGQYGADARYIFQHQLCHTLVQ